MRLILLISFLMSLTFAISQEEIEKAQFTFGLNYRQATTITGSSLKLKQITPYFGISKKRQSLTFGFIIGSKPERVVDIYDNWPDIIGWSVVDGQSETNVYGGFAGYRFFPNGMQKRLNLYLGGTITILNTVNTINGTFFQNIVTMQNTLNIGYNIKIVDWLSFNVGVGAGISLNTAEYRHNNASINDDNVFYRIYNRASPAAEIKAGLEFRF